MGEGEGCGRDHKEGNRYVHYFDCVNSFIGIWYINMSRSWYLGLNFMPFFSVLLRFSGHSALFKEYSMSYIYCEMITTINLVNHHHLI